VDQDIGVNTRDREGNGQSETERGEAEENHQMQEFHDIKEEESIAKVLTGLLARCLRYTWMTRTR
jgi:hypothetical protein